MLQKIPPKLSHTMSAKDAAAPTNAAGDEDDVPALMEGETQPNVALTPDAAEAAAGKQGKKYAKAMAKLGLKPEPGIMRVQIRKFKGISFALPKPEVYRFPNTNTFVIFGETQMEDLSSDAQKAAARAVAGAAATDAPIAVAPAAAAEEEQEESAEGVDEKGIEVVMQQAATTRAKAIRALKANKGDIVNAIMELTM